MTSPWNPFAFTLAGEVKPIEAPPILRARGGELSVGQAALARSVFGKFISTARTSQARNPTQIGRLPDGSIYRITVVGPQTFMDVWPVSVGRNPPVELLNGLLRMNGYLPGGLYDEFHESYTSGYVMSPKFVSPLGNYVVGSWIWSKFDRPFSGPTAKFAQFMRGGAIAYENIFESIIDVREPGDGMFVVGSGDSAKAYFYRAYKIGQSYEIRSIAAQMVASSEFTKDELPADIRNLFGGHVPIAPKETDWSHAIVIISGAQMTAAMGRERVDWIQGGVGYMMCTVDHGLAFPIFASAGDGRAAYTLASFYGTSVLFDTELRLLGFSFGHVESGGGFLPTGTVSAHGAIGPHTPSDVGTWTAPIGVTHVNGVLTEFWQKATVSEFPSLVAGDPPIKQLVSVEVEVSGGHSGSYLTWEYSWGKSSTSGQSYREEKTVRTGTVTTVGGDGATLVFSTWEYHQNAEVTYSVQWLGSRRTQLRSFGLEGAFMLSEFEFDATEDTHIDASISHVSDYGTVLISRSQDGVTTTYPDRVPVTNVDSGGIVHQGSTAGSYEYPPTVRWTSSFSPASPTSPPNVIDSPALALGQYRRVFGSLSVTHESDVHGVARTAKLEWRHVSTRVHLDGKTVDVQSMNLLEDGESSVYIRGDGSKFSLGIVHNSGFAQNDPMFLIRYNVHEVRSDQIRAIVSRLGGSNMVFDYMKERANAAGKSGTIRRSFNIGNMTNTAKDHNYGRTRAASFIGFVP